MGGIDSGRWLRASGHLDRVLELAPHERDGFLAELRESHPEAGADVEAMLKRHRRLDAEGFLDAPPPIQPLEPTLTGVTIGAYTLVSPIGHGGMGSVWLATRSDGRFEGQAALKLLNTALVGRDGEDRFKREGTILARLAHPHIARLTDAGVSNTGQPYLVLELIDGRHIDTFCDDERLDIDARIRLFLDVQAAVAHAHANLVVHRDLKPSNVLVTRDGQVKLLDFGIAKLIEDEPGQPRITRDAGAVLTPKYAAPEQVTGGPITTATDVYSLGVLLYELLSGHHPAGPARSPSEFVRAVVETEPLRLSAAVPDEPKSETITSLAFRRATTPDRLRRALSGDIETILSKALKKDPAERYASVAEFADDLRRYVDHQPIGARPDALSYRAAKFVRRQWRILGVAAAAAAVLLGLVGFYTVRLATERDRARLEAQKASKISDLLSGLLTGANPYRTPDAKPPTIQNLLDAAAERVPNELRDQPELQAEMFRVIGLTYSNMGNHAKALPLLEQAVAIGRATFGTNDVRVAQSLNDLGRLHDLVGNSAAAEPLLVESLAIRRQLLGNNDKDVAVTLVELSHVLRGQGRHAESEAPTREALAIRKRIFGDEHRETAVSKNELGRLLWERGELPEAESLYRESLATNRRLLGTDHPNVAATISILAMLVNAGGDPAGAEKLHRESLDITGRTLGEQHFEYANGLNNTAAAIELQGRHDEALALYDRALAIGLPQLGNEHPDVITYMLNRARLLIRQGRGAREEATLRHVLAVRQKLYRSGQWRIGQTQSLLAAALIAQRRYAEAEPLMREADQVLKPIPGNQARERVANRARLVSLLEKTGRAQEAATYRP